MLWSVTHPDIGVPLVMKMPLTRRVYEALDLPPLKWSSLKYDFRMEDEIDGKEEAYG